MCNPDSPKKPAYKHWLKQPPSSARVINWIREGGAIGLIPVSIDSAVLDCDKGNPEKLARDCPPYAHYESRTVGHRHLWYQSRQPVQLYLWQFEGCSGEVISNNRHVSLPTPEHIGLLYQGMLDNSNCSFPDISLLSPHTPLSDSDKSFITCDSITDNCHSLSDSDIGIGIPDTGDASNLIGKVDTLRVDRASVGERNIALFDTLRFWAYKQPRPREYALWEWLVTERALELREHLPSLWDFPEREARDTAKSVARFTWENPQTAASVDSERQRKRAYLRAKRARQKAHNRDNEIIAWRDSHGLSWRAIGARMGVSAEGARKAYNRKKAELSEKGV